jgi:tetratricopeptide (TPR) repeat protein
MQIFAEHAPSLAVADERALLAEALERQPGSAAVRLRLAALSIGVDAFDEAIALLENNASDYEALMLLAAAAMARKEEGDDAIATDAARRAIETSRNAGQRSRALLTRAKQLVRDNQRQAAIALLEEALRLDPTNLNAFERLTIQLFHEGRQEDVLALTDKRLAAGALPTQILAARAMALAKLHRIDEARSVAGVDQFLFQQKISPPEGWDDLPAFNAAVMQELRANPTIRSGRYGTASKASKRIDAPATADAPAIRALLAEISRIVQDYAVSLRGINHPWIAAMPERATLKSWCVMTGAEGHEDWHMHPAGWLSGGYYPQVPQAIELGSSQAGCLAIGLSEGIVGGDIADAFGQILVRPAAGMLSLFPSHSYHRTFPHQTDEQRVCIAFDICPA